MLSFHPLSLADKVWIDERVFAFGSRSADFNFGSMYLWDERYGQLVCDWGGRLITLAHAHDTPIYPFPVGDGELGPVLEAMREYAQTLDFPFVIRGVEEAGCEELERLYPGKFRFTEDVQYGDYLYSAEKLSTLAGKKLHAKRNFINRFLAEHEWRFEVLEKRHFPACVALLDKWDHTGGHENGETVEGEHTAIMCALENYGELGLVGGALFAEGEMIAFTIGERIANDTVDVHFEKAEAEISGAYAMINREFVRHVLSLWPEIRYFNREDDMGLENLRQAKLSYHPEYILRKFTAAWQG